MAGCASQLPISDTDKIGSWETHKNDINKLDVWRFAGRISVRLEDEAWSASLYWQQDHETYNLQIVGPLASGTVAIQGDSDTVSLKTGEGQIYTDHDVGLLMRENLGWSIPVSAMGYWIKGLPEPGTTAEQIILDDIGRITRLVQSGWEVNYQSYSLKGGHQLPSRLQVIRAGITVRLSINSWNISNDN